jgi:hypothetical protein
MKAGFYIDAEGITPELFWPVETTANDLFWSTISAARSAGIDDGDYDVSKDKLAPEDSDYCDVWENAMQAGDELYQVTVNALGTTEQMIKMLDEIGVVLHIDDRGDELITFSIEIESVLLVCHGSLRVPASDIASIMESGKVNRWGTVMPYDILRNLQAN